MSWLHIPAVTTSGLSWYWMALEATVPLAIAFLVAWLFWRGRNAMVGNVVATAIIFGASVVSIGREYFGLQALTRGCIEAQVPCPIHPDAFTRFAIYAFVAMFQIAVIYVTSLLIEERVRRRQFSPEWR